ncbi:MAG: ATP-binding protein [Thermoanaerobaculia bacterium]
MAEGLWKRVGGRSGLSVGGLYGALFLLTAATVWNVSRLVRAAQWVDHTKNVLSELSETLDTVTTAESNDRAFLLTGDPAFLSKDVRTSAEGHFSRLEILLADNPPQRRSAEELRVAVLERLAELRTLEETRERDGLEEAAALVNPRSAERVRQIVSRMERHEAALLRERQGASRGVVRSTVATLAAGGILLLLLILAFHRDLRRREGAQRAISEARQAAEGANARKDRFLASLSHELRTPLTPIFAGAELLEREPLSAAAREVTVMIRRNLELEARLIDDLLDLARVVQGKIELRSANVDLHAIVAHAVETCRPEVRAGKIDLRVDLDAATHHVWGDAARLEQVFWNLLKNATKFTPPGGSITIRSFNDPGGRVRVTCSDSGIGILPDNLARVFQPFEQGKRARGFGGLGLGLSIAKAIVDQHGGSISVRSDGKGKGSVFEIGLPTIVARERDEAPEGARPTAVRHARILVVEDHADTAQALRSLLALEGHEVVLAGSMGEAIAAHRECAADLVLTDIGLPDGSGLELLAALRSIHSVPGIVVSGFGMPDDLARSRGAGFRAHLVKPVTADRLSAAIRLALRDDERGPLDNS